MQFSDHYIFNQDLTDLEFDIAFIGAGLSSTMTLINYLKQKISVSHGSPETADKIVVVEKSPDFFKGIAYGQRSGHNSLIINSLADFLPPEEFEEFQQWLITNIDTIFIPFLREQENFSKAWYAKNRDAILTGDIGSIYLPRYIFGEYLQQKAIKIIVKAKRCGIAEVSCVLAHASNVTTEACGSKFIVEVERNLNMQSFFCNSVILGVGSTPENVIVEDNNIAKDGYFRNPFNPGMTNTISKINKIFKKQDSNNVLIVGTNASALDVIVNLTSSCELRDRLNKITVMSPSGELPELYLESEEHIQYKTVLLDKLIDRPNTTAAEILEQVKAEVTLARNQGYTVAMSLGSVSATVFKILPTLDAEQKIVFVNSVGNLIGKVQRRAGADYYNILEQLIDCGKLETISGRFKSLENKCDSYDIRYINSSDSICDLQNIQVVINCTGASKLPTKAKNTFLDKLLESGICEVNGSQVGIKVDSDYQTKTKGLYVIGPMLAGNIINDQLVWHIEHCRRISIEAKKLAGKLIDRELSPTYSSAVNGPAAIRS